MKAITITQPYCTLIAVGMKHFETRSWSTNYRGQIALHAGKEMPDKTCFNKLQTDFSKLGYGGMMQLPRGEVLAIAELVDCFEMTTENIAAQTFQERVVGGWKPGRFAWKLANVRRINPVYGSGAQRLWEWHEGDAILKALDDRATER